MLLKLGDRGPAVSELQNMLAHLGYGLLVDSAFGNLTFTAVKAFQTQAQLGVDGVVGDLTYAALKTQYDALNLVEETAGAKEYAALQVDTAWEMPAVQYNKWATPKKLIFLHFTAGSGSAKNTIQYWNSDAQKVATAYVIDRNTGAITEAYNPDYWGWHLGIAGQNNQMDSLSIGIEICNYGPLKLKNGKYYAWPNNYSGTVVDPTQIVTLPTEYRGFKYYQDFTPTQLTNLERLLEWLIEHYEIPVQKSFDASWFNYQPDLIKHTTPGIWTHVNVRQDKNDLWPDDRILAMLNRLAVRFNS